MKRVIIILVTFNFLCLNSKAQNAPNERVSEVINTLSLTLKDSTLFAFWKSYAGMTKVRELEAKALSNPELYADICENPFKFMETSTGRTLLQRVVGVWYAIKTTHNEPLFLTKNRPKVAFDGLQVFRFLPDYSAIRTDYSNESQTDDLDITWFNDDERNSLIINGIGRKVVVQPNGDLRLPPLSKKDQEAQIADNPEDFLIGTWQRQLPLAQPKGSFYTEILTVKEEGSFSLNNGDSGTCEVLDTSEKEMAKGKLTLECTVTKRKELNVDLSIGKLVFMAEKAQIKIKLTQQELFIKVPDFRSDIPFTKK